MKKSLVSFFLLFLALHLYAQEVYYIVHLRGKISTQGGKALKVGDKLSPNERIRFNPEQAAAVLVSSRSGRFSLSKPAGEKPSANGEFLAYLKNTLVPLKVNGQLSTRSPEEGPIVNLKDVLNGDDFVFLENTSKLVLSPATYPMSAQKFFVYTYTYQGKAVNKKIRFSKDTLIIEKKALYVVNGQPIMPRDASAQAELFYFDRQANTSQKIASFKPVFVDEQEAQEETQALLAVFKESQPSAIAERFYEHVRDVYGRTDKQMLSQWVRDHFRR